MAITKKIINEDLQKLLIGKVYKTFGKTITHSLQCERLCEEIKFVTRKKLGNNTVRRFLGFLNTSFSTSLNTLNILSDYAGYDDWHSFTEKSSNLVYVPLSIETESNFYLNFYKIEIREEGDMNYHNACRNIAFRILFNNALLENLSIQLAKNKIAQIYFYERFPFIDGLASSYQKSLKFYIQNKTDEQALIFGNSLLFLSAFLGCNTKELNIYHTRINKISLNDSMHPFIIARYIGTNILFAKSKNEDVDIWIKEVQLWNAFFLRKKNINFWHYPYFQHMICDYLNLAEYFEDSSKISKTINQLNGKYEVEDGYEEALNIICNISKHLISKEKYINWFEEKTAFALCNPLFKKYYELQANCIYYSLLKKSKKKEVINKTILELINQTGFTFFNKHLD